jgi:hypothetical protein
MQPSKEKVDLVLLHVALPPHPPYTPPWIGGSHQMNHWG